MQIKITVSPLLIAILISPALLSADRCLIVGISQFAHVPGINGPLGDVEKFIDIAHEMGFSDDEIIILKNESATKDSILRYFKDIFVDQADTDDVVAFMFSSHGTQVPDTNGDEADGYDEALVPYDAQSEDDLIVDDQIAEIVGSSPARLKILLFDTCHSGDAYKSFFLNMPYHKNNMKYISPSMFGLKTFYRQIPGYKDISIVGDLEHSASQSHSEKGLIFLSASGAGEVAYGAINGLDASVFTYALHKGLTFHSADLNGDGKITFEEARYYAAHYIQDDLKVEQTPQIFAAPQELASLSIRGLVRVQMIESSEAELNSLEDILENAYFRRNTNVLITSPESTYYVGDKLSFTVISPISGYINIVAVEPSGEVHLLFPNKFKPENNFIRGNQEFRIPEDIGGFSFKAVEPTGTSKIYVFVTDRPTNMLEYLRDYGKFQKGSPFIGISNNSHGKKGLRAVMVEAIGNSNGSSSPDISFGVGKITITIKESYY